MLGKVPWFNEMGEDFFRCMDRYGSPIRIREEYLRERTTYCKHAHDAIFKKKSISLRSSGHRAVGTW